MLARHELRSDAAARAARDVAVRLRANPGSAELLVGTDPGLLPALEALGGLPLAWGRTGVWPASELVVPESHTARRWPGVWQALAVPARFNPIAVDPQADADGARAAARQAALLAAPPCRGVIDVAFLLLRADGGVAGLSAASPLLRERADVGAAPGAQGLAEVSVTLSLLARARGIVLLAAPDCPPATVAKVLAGDISVPAGRLRHPQFVLFQSAG